MRVHILDKYIDLMFAMPLWKEFQLLKVLNDLSIKHLIKLILYENNVKPLREVLKNLENS